MVQFSEETKVNHLLYSRPTHSPQGYTYSEPRPQLFKYIHSDPTLTALKCTNNLDSGSSRPSHKFQQTQFMKREWGPSWF
ncbi:hypothetical protein AJ78_07666 [Emergomyces pasteurianus Ep9510]|uniref:Uncharacterized protein n=1 Tax=Emergomyces pasteurianus Ep9510 TaxID=1447872 RepID=A0A1J9PUQ2_9EURO|nr:hypothetical protein AJ78_07666 [Emergomyces pasteurianus Ep9510]